MLAVSVRSLATMLGPMIGKPIPNASRAEIPAAKLRDYCLNPDHPDGAHKARVFMSALGIGRDDWRYLSDQLLAGVAVAPLTADTHDQHGIRFEVQIEVQGLNGRTLPVTTAWFLPKGGDAPRLVSAYVAVKR
jgi:Domain of unknown function (DUF6883)